MPEEEIIIAIDPGTKKCGYAVVDSNLSVLQREVTSTEGIIKIIEDSFNVYKIDEIILGNGTNYKQIEKKLRENIEESIILFNYFSKELVDKMYQKAKDLSQADKKRVEICRALASRPKLLLLDEPSAGMNPEETTELMEDIKKIKIKKPDLNIILIEHDMRVIKGSTQRVIVFNHGVKIFEGTFEKASNNKEVIEAYLGGEI